MRDVTISNAISGLDRVPARTLTRFEQRAIFVLLGSLALYTLCLLPAARSNYQALGSTLHGFATISVFLTAVIALVDLLYRRSRWCNRTFGLADMLWYAAAAMIGSMTIPIYGIFKQLVLPARGFPLDPILARADRLLFLGHDPWTLTHAVFGSLWPTMAFDTAYSGWMPMMFVFPALAVALVRSPVARARLIGCWLFAWIVVGSIAAWLLASAGPCYYDIVVAPDPGFHQLNLHLAKLAAHARAAGVMIGSQHFQPQLLLAQASGHYVPAAGISAAPSMHVTMATLFAIAGFQIGRKTGQAMTAFAVLIWIGSIHLGWHYAVDGIIGSAMMLAMWRLSGLLTRRAAEAQRTQAGLINRTLRPAD